MLIAVPSPLALDSSLLTQVETLIAQLLGNTLEGADQLVLRVPERYVGVLRLDHDLEFDCASSMWAAARTRMVSPWDVISVA
jgi:hypothetical protein